MCISASFAIPKDVEIYAHITAHKVCLDSGVVSIHNIRLEKVSLPTQHAFIGKQHRIPIFHAAFIAGRTEIDGSTSEDLGSAVSQAGLSNTIRAVKSPGYGGGPVGLEIIAEALAEEDMKLIFLGNIKDAPFDSWSATIRDSMQHAKEHGSKVQPPVIH